MTDWRAQTVDGSYAVLLQAPVLRDLDRFCSEAGASETGGILIGRYSDDLAVAVVREATPPPADSRRGRSWFVRGVSGLRDMLGRRWRAKERTYYVGEWHFHPVQTVEPSTEDFAQMLEIARGREYDCKAPLLLILGAGSHEGARALRAFVCPAGCAPLELRPSVDSSGRASTAGSAPASRTTAFRRSV
ncbi:Mov34/MPN/PAD-1 family protein [Sorangium sp. So ce185]|uniref:Mov34/MPN/PAD-1 family protein n=1 Tax=Sorangium sp. So ce185 TaxID=3133287 RepID=UPI003F5E8D7F